MLNQHLRVHGLPPVKGEGALGLSGSDQYGSDSDTAAMGSEAEAEAEAAEAGEMIEEMDLDGETSSTHSDAPTVASAASASASASAAALASAGADGYVNLGLNPATLPKLADSATMALTDIPLTWVSKGNKFYKMYKCRYCPHVNVRKANIQVRPCSP